MPNVVCVDPLDFDRDPLILMLFSRILLRANLTPANDVYSLFTEYMI